MSTNKGESLAHYLALSHWPAEGGGPTGVAGGKWVALLDSLDAATINLIDRAYMGALYDLEVQPPSDVGTCKGEVRLDLKRAIAELVSAGERDELRLRERAICQAVVSRFG